MKHQMEKAKEKVKGKEKENSKARAKEKGRRRRRQKPFLLSKEFGLGCSGVKYAAFVRKVVS